MTNQTTTLEMDGKVRFSKELYEILGINDGDTVEIFTNQKEDEILIIPQKIDKSLLESYSVATLNSEAVITLPEKLIEDFTLNENEVLNVSVDTRRSCIVLKSVSPICVFCGEIGDKPFKGKYICVDCTDEIVLGN